MKEQGENNGNLGYYDMSLASLDNPLQMLTLASES